jgi:hypothetical protein
MGCAYCCWKPLVISSQAEKLIKGAVILREVCWDLVDRDPDRSMRSVAKEIGLSWLTIQKMMKEIKFRI